MENSDLTLERLAGIVRMVKAVKKSETTLSRPTPDKSMTDFDLRFETPAIKTIKAAIPYLDVKYQRELGVMVKLIEIDKLLGEYRAVEKTSLREGDSIDMLRAIVPNLPEESRNMGEMLIRLLEIKELAEDWGV